MLTNLVGNALKFTSAHGLIRVRTLIDHGMIVLSVEDNGPGISLNDQDHLFERYWQIKNTVEKGTGLGLSISKGIVEAHKGTIEVESKLGEGTTFTIRLPLS